MKNFETWVRFLKWIIICILKTKKQVSHNVVKEAVKIGVSMYCRPLLNILWAKSTLEANSLASTFFYVNFFFIHFHVDKRKKELFNPYRLGVAICGTG